MSKFAARAARRLAFALALSSIVAPSSAAPEFVPAGAKSAASASADGSVEAAIGGTTLRFPAPAGYVQLTPAMPRLYALQQRFVAPQNRLVAAFIPPGAALAGQRGEVPDIDRQFAVQVARSIENQTLSDEDFVKVRDALHTQMQAAVDSARTQVDQQLQSFGNDMAKGSGASVSVKTGGMRLLPPHEETPRNMAISMLMSVQAAVNGRVENVPIAVTMNVVDVRGKALFLYVYGDGQDLEWTRRAAHDWAEAVFAANPSTGTVESTHPFGGGGFDFGKMLGKIVAGALIAGIFAFIVHLVRR